MKHFFIKATTIIFFFLLFIFLFYNNEVYAGELNHGIYYASLNDSQKEIYNEVYDNMMAYNEATFKLPHPIVYDELRLIMNSVYNDHPEIFWVRTAYRYGLKSDGTITQLKLRYCVDKKDLEEAKLLFDSVIEIVIEKAANCETTLEKEKIIHDVICDITKYDLENDKNQSAYSSLVEGSSICAGYSRAFQVCCNRLGIDCYYVLGETNIEEHAWNIVNIDGVYYNVDITSDDVMNEAYGFHTYEYFNVSDEKLAKTHKRDTVSEFLPKCTQNLLFSNILYYFL